MKLKATHIPHSTPISKKLASNFIELGYGLQVEGMAAEMFFNRRIGIVGIFFLDAALMSGQLTYPPVPITRSGLNSFRIFFASSGDVTV